MQRLFIPFGLCSNLLNEVKMFIPFGLCSNLLNEVKMYVKARYFLILVLDIIGRIEKTLGDDANEKNYQKAKKEVKQYKEKRKKLLDKYVDDGIDKETYMSMDAEYEVKYAEAQSQLEYYEKQVQGDDSLRKRIEGFRKTLTQNQVLEEFDRAVFESIVEKVIVGGYDDDGNADPYKVTFIYKTGFKDSFDHAKTKFGPKSKKSDENVSSNSSVHQENQCSNHSVDTRRDGSSFRSGKSRRIYRH